MMEIPTFTTRLKIESYKGRKAHRWIQRRLVAEEATCHPNILIQMQREDGAPPKREGLRYISKFKNLDMILEFRNMMKYIRNFMYPSKRCRENGVVPKGYYKGMMTFD